MKFEDLWRPYKSNIWVSVCGRFGLGRFGKFYDCGYWGNSGFTNYLDLDTDYEFTCHNIFIKIQPEVTTNLYSLLYIGK